MWRLQLKVFYRIAARAPISDRHRVRPRRVEGGAKTRRQRSAASQGLRIEVPEGSRWVAEADLALQLPEWCISAGDNVPQLTDVHGSQGQAKLVDPFLVSCGFK